MKSVLLCSAISIFSVMASGVASGALADDLKPFEFKGVTAGAEIDPHTVGDCKGVFEDGTVRCTVSQNSVAGIDSGTPEMHFYNKRLYKMVYVFGTNNFDKLNKSLTEKYGTPCEQNSEDLLAGGTKVLENDIVSWCFSSGKLTLKAMDSGVSRGSLIYIDKNKPAKQKPTIDF